MTDEMGDFYEEIQTKDGTTIGVSFSDMEDDCLLIQVGDGGYTCAYLNRTQTNLLIHALQQAKLAWNAEKGTTKGH